MKFVWCFCISSMLIAITLAKPLIESEDDLKPKRFLSVVAPKQPMWISPKQMEVKRIFILFKEQYRNNKIH